jgi:hypothetical protein
MKAHEQNGNHRNCFCGGGAGVPGLFEHAHREYRVEVCVAFHGANQCRTASADTQDHALRSAQSNACALLVSGVTETMQCEHQDPVSVKWLETK